MSVYSTDDPRHQRNHPAAERKTLPAVSPIPESVEVWNVEAHCSLAITVNPQASFSLRRELWQSIGRPPRVSVTRAANGGFYITWGGTCAVQYDSQSKTSAVKVVANPRTLGLPVEARGSHVIKACSRNGVIEVDPPHPEWIAGDEAFQHQYLPRGDSKVARLSANPQTGAVAPKPTNGNGSAAAHNGGGVTAPLPKARPPELPQPTRIEILQGRLKQKLGEVMEIKRELEQATGLRFTLTRDGRFVVNMER